MIDLEIFRPIRNQLSSAESYVNFWCIENEIEFSLFGRNTIKQNGTALNMTLSQIFNTLWLNYETACLHYKDTLRRHAATGLIITKLDPTLQLDLIKESTMLKAFEARRDKAITAQREKIKESVKYVKPSNELEKWLTALTGKCDPLDLAVMQHFLWGIKQRMKYITPIHIKFPIVYGLKQQNGKSTAIRALLEPISVFKMDRTISELLDERNAKSLSEFYVCFLDEMVGMGRVESEAMKRVVTQDKVSYRPFYSQTTETVFVTCSLIGASNKPVEELIFDTSGQARFWQINAANEIDRDAINSVNYLELWQSIDENLEKGYIINSLGKISETQQESTMEDFIKVFLDEMGFVAGVYDKFVAVSEVHEAYMAFCTIHGEKPKTAAWFSRTAKKYGLKSGSILKEKGRGYRVNSGFLKDAEKVNDVKKGSVCLTQ